MSNIFSHIPLEREVLPLATVNRWWNKMATERLWYKFRGLKNDNRTKSFAKFLGTLKLAKEGKCFHNYGKYVRILELPELDKLKISHQTILETLDCCPRIEEFCIGDRILDKDQVYDFTERLPNLRFFKFLESVDINDGRAMGALAQHCPYLEVLELKKDIACAGEVLLWIVEKCQKISRVDIFEKNYEDEIMIQIFRMIPNITSLTLHQCISVSEEFLLDIFKFCPKLVTLKVTNMAEVTTAFVLATAKNFKNCPRITVYKVDRPLDSRVEASERDLKAYLYDCDLAEIIDYYTNRKGSLEELTLIELHLNKKSFEVICEKFDLLKLELRSITGLKKSDILGSLPNLKNLHTFFVRFSDVSPEPLLNKD
ncbi:4320_t:CDS:2, partial [Acaulospora morrowiae]